MMVFNYCKTIRHQSNRFSNLNITFCLRRYVIHNDIHYATSPLGWSCRIHRLHHCRRVRLTPRVFWIYHLIIWWYYLPTPPLGQDMTQNQFFFKWSLTGLNSEFSFSWTSCLTKAEEHSLSYYLHIDGGRIIGFIPFPRVLVQCEMQSVSSRIWTRVAVSISYDDDDYTTGTS